MSYTENATCAIRKEGDHWRHEHDGGDHPGLFVDADAARGGCNVTPDDAVEINKTRLINEEDVRASIRKRLAMTNTPSPDEDRELIARLRRESNSVFPSRMRDGHAYHATAYALDKAADRLESLLSDRATALDKATVDAVLVAVDNRSVPTMDATWSAAWNAAMDFVSKAIVEARALNRSTDRAT